MSVICKWTICTCPLCYLDQEIQFYLSAKWLFTAPELSQKLQIIFLHFCISSQRRSDRQRVINWTVIVMVLSYQWKLYQFSYLYATAFCLSGLSGTKVGNTPSQCWRTSDESRLRGWLTSTASGFKVALTHHTDARHSRIKERTVYLSTYVSQYSSYKTVKGN